MKTNKLSVKTFLEADENWAKNFRSKLNPKLSTLKYLEEFYLWLW